MQEGLAQQLCIYTNELQLRGTRVKLEEENIVVFADVYAKPGREVDLRNILNTAVERITGMLRLFFIAFMRILRILATLSSMRYGTILQQSMLPILTILYSHARTGHARHRVCEHVPHAVLIAE